MSPHTYYTPCRQSDQMSPAYWGFEHWEAQIHSAQTPFLLHSKFSYLACIRRCNPCYAPRTAASCLPRSAAEARRAVSGHCSA